METGMAGRTLLDRNGILYPMLVIAAIAVIIVSAVGVAMVTGLLPRAESTSEQRPATDPQVNGPRATKRAAMNEPQAAQRADVNQPQVVKKAAVAGGMDEACNNCGVIESITPVESKGQGSGIGAVAGGVTGALIGNQIGRGNGNTAATIAGAAGGAFAGNAIEKNMKKTLRYQVRVRMSDGSYRTTSHSIAPAFAIGDKVRIVNGQAVAGG